MSIRYNALNKTNLFSMNLFLMTKQFLMIKLRSIKIYKRKTYKTQLKNLLKQTDNIVVDKLIFSYGIAGNACNRKLVHK